MERRNSKVKVSINVRKSNEERLQKMMEMTGSTRTEVINDAIASVPIINLGDRRELSELFFEIRKEMNNDEEMRKKVAEACRLLDLLMEKIESFRN